MTTTVDTARPPETTYNHCLNFYEQMEVISKARLSLSLRAPDDGMTLEKKNALHEEQKQKILNFVDLLHNNLISENGKVILCLYSCK
jgi:hypothetical protein